MHKMVETVVELILDNSGSMGAMDWDKTKAPKYLIDGQTRMSLVKKILLDEIIPVLDYCSQLFIRTFRTEVEGRDEKLKQKGIETPLIYAGAFDADKIRRVIAAIQDPGLGGSPIAQAIEAAVMNLEKYPQFDRKIILLTDGEENAGGDYKLAAKRASALTGIPCKIFIVGLALDSASMEKAKEIATGGFVHLNASKFSPTEIKTALASLKKVVLQDSIKNIEQIKAAATSFVEPENPQVQNHAPGTIQNLQNRLEELQKEGGANALGSLDALEGRLRDQIANSEQLLKELISLRELIMHQQFVGVDATTLTIDSEYSEGIRKRSETYLYQYLCEKYSKPMVRWLNKDGENNAPHDFELLDESGHVVQLIDCKGTAREKPTFYLTKHEWNHFLKNRERYQIYRVFNVEGEMRIEEIGNLFNSLMEGKVVPYLLKPEVLKEERVFLTIVYPEQQQKHE